MEDWEVYEEVAIHILDQIALQLDLDLERVEGKQHIYGFRSSTSWEIDGKGVLVDGEGFVIIECRRHTTSKQNQERVAALAYRIIDAGATGGILVSPLGFQEGARKVAAAEGIHEIFLDQNSTRTNYIAKFLENIFLGISITLPPLAVSGTVEVTPADGT